MDCCQPISELVRELGLSLHEFIRLVLLLLLHDARLVALVDIGHLADVAVPRGLALVIEVVKRGLKLPIAVSLLLQVRLRSLAVVLAPLELRDAFTLIGLIRTLLLES